METTLVSEIIRVSEVAASEAWPLVLEQIVIIRQWQSATREISADIIATTVRETFFYRIIMRYLIWLSDLVEKTNSQKVDSKINENGVGLVQIPKIEINDGSFNEFRVRYQ